jgi:hypothetical protein
MIMSEKRWMPRLLVLFVLICQMIEVIHALIDEEKAENLPKVRAPIYGEKFD